MGMDFFIHFFHVGMEENIFFTDFAFFSGFSLFLSLFLSLSLSLSLSSFSLSFSLSHLPSSSTFPFSFLLMYSDLSSSLPRGIPVEGGERRRTEEASKLSPRRSTNPSSSSLGEREMREEEGGDGGGGREREGTHSKEVMTKKMTLTREGDNVKLVSAIPRIAPPTSDKTFTQHSVVTQFRAITKGLSFTFSHSFEEKMKSDLEEENDLSCRADSQRIRDAFTRFIEPISSVSFSSESDVARKTPRKEKTPLNVAKYICEVTLALDPPLPSLSLKEDSLSKFQSTCLVFWKEDAEKRWGTSNRWPEILNLTSILFPRSKDTDILEELKGLFQKFRSAIKQTWASNVILEKIILHFFNYLHLRTSDPFNVGVGTPLPPSSSLVMLQREIDSTFSNLTALQGKILCWQTLLREENGVEIVKLEIDSIIQSARTSQSICGELVAVEINSLPSPFREKYQTVDTISHLIARLSSFSENDCAQIIIDPTESFELSVPASSLFKIETELSDVSEPVLLRNLFDQVDELVLKHIDSIIQKIGGRIDLLEDQTINLSSLPEFHQSRSLLINLSKEYSDSDDRCLDLFEEVGGKIVSWIQETPGIYFRSPIMERAIIELQYYIERLPLYAFIVVQSKLHNFDAILRQIEAKIRKVISGEAKQEVSTWWLSYIEEQVDLFLDKRNYIHNSLPEDYLNCAPQNLQIVQNNFDILQDLPEKHFEELNEFVDLLVDDVYEIVDGLMYSFWFVLESDWAKFMIDRGLGEMLSEKKRTAMQEDYNYLTTMKEMDKEYRINRTTKKKIELSNVVPMSGLVFARFHMYGCELGTALEMWSPANHNRSAIKSVVIQSEKIPFGQEHKNMTFSLKEREREREREKAEREMKREASQGFLDLLANTNTRHSFQPKRSRKDASRHSRLSDYVVDHPFINSAKEAKLAATRQNCQEFLINESVVVRRSSSSALRIKAISSIKKGSSSHIKPSTSHLRISSPSQTVHPAKITNTPISSSRRTAPPNSSTLTTTSSSPTATTPRSKLGTELKSEEERDMIGDIGFDEGEEGTREGDEEEDEQKPHRIPSGISIALPSIRTKLQEKEERNSGPEKKKPEKPSERPQKELSGQQRERMNRLLKRFDSSTFVKVRDPKFQQLQKQLHHNHQQQPLQKGQMQQRPAPKKKEAQSPPPDGYHTISFSAKPKNRPSLSPYNTPPSSKPTLSSSASASKSGRHLSRTKELESFPKTKKLTPTRSSSFDAQLYEMANDEDGDYPASTSSSKSPSPLPPSSSPSLSHPLPPSRPPRQQQSNSQPNLPSPGSPIEPSSFFPSSGFNQKKGANLRPLQLSQSSDNATPPNNKKPPTLPNSSTFSSSSTSSSTTSPPSSTTPLSSPTTSPTSSQPLSPIVTTSQYSRTPPKSPPSPRSPKFPLMTPPSPSTSPLLSLTPVRGKPPKKPNQPPSNRVLSPSMKPRNPL